MPLIVQKFGGSSVADPEKILAAARKAIRAATTRQSSGDGRQRHGRHDGRPDRIGQQGLRTAARAGNGHAVVHGRTGQRGVDGHGHPLAGLQGRELDRCPDRHQDGRHAHQGADQVDFDRPRPAVAERRQYRHRRRIPGDRRRFRHHHAGARRQRHHGGRPGGGAECRRLRDLHRRGRRLHHGPAAVARSAARGTDQLRRDAGAGQPGRRRDAQPVDRVRQEVRRRDPRPQQLQRFARLDDRRASRNSRIAPCAARRSSRTKPAFPCWASRTGRASACRSFRRSRPRTSTST